MNLRADPILVMLLAASLSGNVYFYRHQARHALVAAPVPRAGERVPPLVGFGLEGESITVDFRDRPAIIYAFAPTCGWCQRNLENAKALAAQTSAEFDFIAVDVGDGDVTEYLRARKLPWRVIRAVRQDVREVYGLIGTPTTIVVGIGGTVLYSWPGAYTGSTATNIEAALKVRLPGLSAASQ